MQDQFPIRQTGKTVKMEDLVRRETGLVNDINPPRPQPSKTKRTTLGGKKAGKILRRQR